MQIHIRVVIPVVWRRDIAAGGVLGDGLLDYVHAQSRGIGHGDVALHHGGLSGHYLIALGHVVLQVLEDEEVGQRRQQMDGGHLRHRAQGTVMRRHGIEKPYERLKALTRGRSIDRKTLHAFIESLDLPADEKTRLLALTPSSYVGAGEDLANDV